MLIGKILTTLVALLSVCLSSTGHLCLPPSNYSSFVDYHLFPDQIVSQGIIANTSPTVNATSTPGPVLQSGSSFIGSPTPALSPSPSESPNPSEKPSGYEIWDKVFVPIICAVLGFLGAILGGIIGQNHADKISDKKRKKEKTEAADKIIRDILARFESDLGKTNTVAITRFESFKNEITSINNYREREIWDADIAKDNSIESLLNTIEKTINDFKNGNRQALSAKILKELKDYLESITRIGD